MPGFEGETTSTILLNLVIEEFPAAPEFRYACDATAPPQSARELYNRAAGVRELHYVIGADHAESVLVAPDEYREVAATFIGQI